MTTHGSHYTGRDEHHATNKIKPQGVVKPDADTPCVEWHGSTDHRSQPWAVRCCRSGRFFLLTPLFMLTSFCHDTSMDPSCGARRARANPATKKANRSPLAVFISESCVFAGVAAGSCGLRHTVPLPAQSPIPLSPVPSSLALASVKFLKSASTKILVITDQWLTRGLFKRLDGVIA
jgi:hypothetical protein